MKKVMNWILAAILVFGAMTALTSCSNDDKVVELDQEGYAGMPLIIYDTDIGSSADDLFALEMLYRYEDEGRCRLLGVVVDREGNLLGAFVGDECRGHVTLSELGSTLLVIYGRKAGELVTLKYYEALTEHLFTIPDAVKL